MNVLELMINQAIPGPTEMMIILVIVLVLFGGSKIPQLGDSLGKGIRNFKRSFNGEDEPEAEVVETKAITEEPNAEVLKEQLKDEVEN